MSQRERVKDDTVSVKSLHFTHSKFVCVQTSVLTARATATALLSNLVQLV